MGHHIAEKPAACSYGKENTNTTASRGPIANAAALDLLVAAQFAGFANDGVVVIYKDAHVIVHEVLL